jgi:predicted NAD/FAD-binding protein
VRFNANHGLMQLTNRPLWRTVRGGSRCYVQALLASQCFQYALGTPITAVKRYPDHVALSDQHGHSARFDHVVLACHTDQSLALLSDAQDQERALLSAISYTKNDAWVHSDERFMPKRRKVWSSWNYLGTRGHSQNATHVTYWMNLLQNLPRDKNIFVTLNPEHEPDPATLIHKQTYHHPLFNPAAMQAQKDIWHLQGHNRTWFGGAWMGAGFHEDGLQAGLAIAEMLGGVKRPWQVKNASARLSLPLTHPLLAEVKR